MNVTYDIIFVLDGIISIVLKVIGICALCTWIITGKTNTERRNNA